MDCIFESWLQRQHECGMALAAASDVLKLAADESTQPARRYIAHFDCPTMVRSGAEVIRAQGFIVHFQFPPEYLRVPIDPASIVNLIAPRVAYHPNVAPPFICVGHVTPGTELVELIHQVHEILTFNKLTPVEHNALNPEACAWARRHMHLFPLTTAPLRCRTVDFTIAEIARQEAPDAFEGP